MANTVYVKPRAGARIRQPDRNGTVMAPEGGFVSADDTFYIRLINSGDLVVVESKKKPEAKADEAKPKK